MDAIIGRELDWHKARARQTCPVQFVRQPRIVDVRRADHFERSVRAAAHRERRLQQTDARVEDRFGQVAHVGRGIAPGQTSLVEPHIARPAFHLNDRQIRMVMPFGIIHPGLLTDSHPVAQRDRMKGHET